MHFSFTHHYLNTQSFLPVSTKETVGRVGEDGDEVTAEEPDGVLLHLKCMEKSLFNTSIKLNKRGRSIHIQLKPIPLGTV
jgi:hypothetical protein